MSQLLFAIQRVLWQEWDPIGVQAMGGPDDEYDSYASHIYLMFQTPTRPSAIEIAVYLNWVQTERIGLELTADHNEAIATMIARL